MEISITTTQLQKLRDTLNAAPVGEIWGIVGATRRKTDCCHVRMLKIRVYKVECSYPEQGMLKRGRVFKYCYGCGREVLCYLM